jgi:hypothetical protein
MNHLPERTESESPEVIPASSSKSQSQKTLQIALMIVGILGLAIIVSDALVKGAEIAKGAVDSSTTAAKEIVEAPLKMAKETAVAVAEAIAPKYTIKQVNMSALSTFKKEAKLVPFSAEMSAESSFTSSKKVLGVNMGDTKVDVKVSGCRVQYYLPLDAIRECDFDFDERTKIWRVVIPQPILDEDFISIPSDPNCWHIKKEIGWGRLEKDSGVECETKARQELRPTIIRQANNPLLLGEARREGERMVKELLEAVLKRHDIDDIRIRVATQ